MAHRVGATVAGGRRDRGLVLALESGPRASCREQRLVGPAPSAAQTAARRVSVVDRRSGLGGRVSGGRRTSDELAPPSTIGDGDPVPTVAFMQTFM